MNAVRSSPKTVLRRVWQLPRAKKHRCQMPFDICGLAVCPWATKLWEIMSRQHSKARVELSLPQSRIRWEIRFNPLIESDCFLLNRDEIMKHRRLIFKFSYVLRCESCAKNIVKRCVLLHDVLQPKCWKSYSNKHCFWNLWCSTCVYSFSGVLMDGGITCFQTLMLTTEHPFIQ